MNYWGHIIREAEFRKPIIVKGRDGEYVADTHGPLTWRFRCDCGFVWELEAKDFPGRRKMRTCGRRECPYANPKSSPSPKEAKSAHSLYLPMALMTEVRAYATRKGLNLSEAVTEILREGLISKLLND